MFEWLFAKKSPPTSLGRESGWSESLLYAKSSWPKYNPDDLRGLRGAGIYRRMMTDEQVKAVVRFRRDVTIGRRWYFDWPAEAGEPDPLKAKVLSKIISDCEGSFFDQLCGILTAIPYGFSLTEKVLKYIEVDGKSYVGLRRLALKPHESFNFVPDEFGNIVKIIQKFDGYQQDIDRANFIHYVQNPDVDPHYGQSELREAYRAWFSKDMAIRFWNIHLERHASGFLKIQPNEGVSITSGSAEHAALLNLINNINPKTGILLPAGINAEMVMPSNTDAFEKSIVAHDKSIAKALLVPNLLGLSEQGATGSYSQSQTQLEAFLWTLEAETKRVEEVLNEQLFKPLGEINFGPGVIPLFRFKPISQSQKMDVIRLWNELTQARVVVSSSVDEAHIRDLIDFPDAVEPEPGQEPITDPLLEPEPEPIPEPAPDETVIGAGQQKIKIPVEARMARAIRRVDFAVIDNRSTRITADTSSRVSDALAQGVSSIKTFIAEADMFANPDKIADVAIPPRIVTKIRKIIESGLRAGWDLGADHARRELGRAAGKTFAADDLRLADLAADKFMESRSYTVAGDLSDSVRKKVSTVLYNGIKGGWALSAIEETIDSELGAVVLPHASTAIRTIVFEAINEARYSLFASPEMDGFVEALEYSAILDGKTTEICEALDGKIYPIDSPQWESITPPLHFNALVAGTPVLTRGGFFPIELIEPGTEVWTHRARWRPVYTLMGKEADQPTILELNLSTGGSLRITKEHPVLTTHGWRVAGDLKVGDVLFEHSEQVEGSCDVALPDPNNFPPLLNEEPVAYSVARFSPFMGLPVNLKHDHVLDKGDVGDVSANAVLKLEGGAADSENTDHLGFVEGGPPPEGSREAMGSGCARVGIVHRVAGSHSTGMAGSPTVGLLAPAPSPMGLAAGMDAGVSIGDGGLLGSSSNSDAVFFAPCRQYGFADTEAALDGSDGLITIPVSELNKVSHSSSVFHVHNKHQWKPAAIINIAAVESNQPLWNLAVEEDETYIAGGVIVHNCRSLLIAVIEGDQWAESDEPTVEPAAGFGGPVNFSVAAPLPAPAIHNHFHTHTRQKYIRR